MGGIRREVKEADLDLSNEKAGGEDTRGGKEVGK